MNVHSSARSKDTRFVRARVVKEIGQDEENKRIEVLIGSLAMEEWRIHPVPHEERLDFTHYPKKFVEFWTEKITLVS